MIVDSVRAGFLLAEYMETGVFHNLDTTDVLIQILGKDANGIHQEGFGTFAYITSLDNFDCKIGLEPEAVRWTELRVWIWKIPPTP